MADHEFSVRQMIRIAFGGRPSPRFATSPSWELIGYARLIARDGHPVVPEARLKRWKRRIQSAEFDLLRSVLSHPDYVPGFLAPAPEEPFASIGADLDRVGATPPEEVQRALAPVVARARQRSDGPYTGLVDRALDPEACRDELVVQMRSLWNGVVAPEWSAHRAALESEVLGRGRALALRGERRLVEELHDDLSWDGEALVLACTAVDLVFDHVQRVLLIPSIFVWPKVFAAPPDADGRILLYYPARGASRLFAERDADLRARRGLEGLLGNSRARLLVALGQPATTLELAARVSLSPGAVSQHLQRLHVLELVARTRVGRRVYYRRSDRGGQLLQLFSPRADRCEPEDHSP